MAPTAGMCELMRALQSSDNAVRGEAEAKLDEAVKGAPNQLVPELLSVLACEEPLGICGVFGWQRVQAFGR